MSDVTLNLDLKAVGIDSTIKSLKEFNKGLKETQKSGSEIEKKLPSGFDKVKSSVDKVGTALKSSPLFTIAATIGVVVGAFSGLNAIMQEGSKKALASDKAYRQMGDSLERNTKLTNEQKKSVSELTKSYGDYTTENDEVIAGMIELGARTNATEEQIKSMVTNALDISAKTGQDANSVMLQLSKSVNDTGSAFMMAKQLGIPFTDSQKDMLNQLQATGKEAEAHAIIMERLNTQFGGESQKHLLSYEGKLESLDGKMSDALEPIGRITNAFSEMFVDFKIDAVENFTKLITNPQVESVIQNLATAFKLIGNILGTAIKESLNVMISSIRIIWEISTSFYDVVFNIGKNITDWLIALQPVQEVVENIRDAFETIIGFVINLKDYIVDTFSNIADGLQALTSFNFDGFKESIIKIKEDSVDLFNAEKNKETFKKTVDTIKNMHEETMKHWSKPTEFTLETSTAVDKIKKVDSAVKETGNVVKKTAEQIRNEMISTASSISSSFSSAFSSISDSVFAFKETNKFNSDMFDEQMDALNSKYEDHYELRRSGEEQIDESSQKQIEYLEKEYNKQDELGKQAIKIKIDEVKAEQKKLDDEKKLKEKESASEKAIEKEKNEAIANLEYQKALSMHNNEVSNAQTKHEQVIADAAIGSTMGVLQGSLGFARAITDLGPIVGPIVGAANMAGVIGSVVGASAEVKSSASALSGLKGQAPKPPAFRFGTQGYNLEQGESAIVGEAGAEMVSMNNGKLQVDSSYQTSQSGVSTGDNINININASQFGYQDMENLIIEVLNGSSIKDRSIINAY